MNSFDVPDMYPGPYRGKGNGMTDEIERLRADNATLRTALQNHGEEAARMVAALQTLAKYFTSGNCIPVDVAVIKAADFWRITGLDADQHVTPTKEEQK